MPSQPLLLVTTEYVPTGDEMLSARARPAPAPVDIDVEEDEPRRGRRWVAWLLPLMLLLAAAAGGVDYIATQDHTRTYQVPHLVGLAESEALNQISGFDWDTVVTREASETVPLGVVIRTQPDEATSLAQRQPFQLIVSTGPAPRPLPDLVGLTLEQAIHPGRMTQLPGAVAGHRPEVEPPIGIEPMTYALRGRRRPAELHGERAIRAGNNQFGASRDPLL